MDIPDLPAGSFEHIGDKKIKPQGGGNPLAPITDPISKALGTDGSGGGISGALADIDPGKSIGKALADIDPGPALGKGLAEVDKFVGREIPGGWTTVGLAAAAAAAPYAMPYLTTPTAGGTAGGINLGGAFVPTAGSGASFTLPAAELAAATAAATEVATALPYTEAFDAANLAKQGLSSSQIAQTLEITAGVDKFIAADMANLAAQGFSPETIVQNLSYSYSPKELAPLGIESKAATLPGSGFSAQKAMQGLRTARGLLAQQPQAPRPPQLQIGGAVTNPRGAVDYSGLLNLLGPRTPQRSNPNSLLG
jgi:hypothetical protein